MSLLSTLAPAAHGSVVTPDGLAGFGAGSASGSCTVGAPTGRASAPSGKVRYA